MFSVYTSTIYYTTIIQGFYIIDSQFVLPSDRRIADLYNNFAKVASFTYEFEPFLNMFEAINDMADHGDNPVGGKESGCINEIFV